MTYLCKPSDSAIAALLGMFLFGWIVGQLPVVVWVAAPFAFFAGWMRGIESDERRGR